MASVSAHESQAREKSIVCVRGLLEEAEMMKGWREKNRDKERETGMERGGGMKPNEEKVSGTEREWGCDGELKKERQTEGRREGCSEFRVALRKRSK